MALDTNATKLANMLDPQVLADMVSAELDNKIKFTPLAYVNNDLEGRPGSTITLPKWVYIGDASDTAEGADISIAQLTKSTANVTIKKVGKGVQITDEAVLSGYGDPIGEIVKQLSMSIASKIDNDLLTVLGGIATGMTYTSTAKIATGADILTAKATKFGENQDGLCALLVSPSTYATMVNTTGWIPVSEMAAEAVIKGAVGEFAGCNVIVTNKLGSTDICYLVKPEALAIYLKRDTQVEYDRNIVNKSTTITADKHYAVYLQDASKAVKIAVTKG